MAITVLPSDAIRRVRRRRPPRAHSAASDLAVHLIAILVIGVMLAPVADIVIGGFRTNSQITVDPSGLPSPWEVGNSLDVLTGGLFWALVGNSLIVALATTVGVVVLGLMVSFVLARYDFPVRAPCMRCSPPA